MERWITTLSAAFLWMVAPRMGFPRAEPASWHGLLRDAAGKPVAGAVVELRPAAGGPAIVAPLHATTDASGAFVFPQLPESAYRIAVRWRDVTANPASPLEIHAGERLDAWLELSAGSRTVSLHPGAAPGSHPSGNGAAPNGGAPANGEAAAGRRLTSVQVSSLPLNQRDFSKLLTLAAGTTTDANGASNFTQQFAINGQRATTAVFAMDGVDTTDPEVGGATFSNFNVDAIEEIQSDSGVMPPTVGEGAAGFTNIITKSGTDQIHGDVFEFVRNAAFDARNFFDRQSLAQPERIPPFARNEFGFTNGGPAVIPGLYDGRGRTFYFGQYQGFRQVLGTTQVFPVPTLAERQGLDTTAFPGDTLIVPVNPQVAPALAHYPLPNDPHGSFGARTYAVSSKVSTDSDEFSVRVDHRLSDRSQLFVRFNFDNTTGPTTNPDQTAIDPSFAILFLDHQRNLALRYTRTVFPNFTAESSFSFIRATPLFTTINQTQPGITFADGLYEPFNSASGQNIGVWGNLFQLRQSFIDVHGTHMFKIGFEARFNRDASIFALDTNGTYVFGGGATYSPVAIPSSSGAHNILPGQPLPDTLSALLTGTPYSFTASVGGLGFPQGSRIGESAIRREAYNAWFEDVWKITPRLTLDYGLRYEVNARIHEAHHLTSGPVILGPDGQTSPYWVPGAQQDLRVNPQPPYAADYGGWGPRLSLSWEINPNTRFTAGGALTTLLPNLFIDNGLTGGIPYVLNPYFTALPGAPVPFAGAVTPFHPPPVFAPGGQPIFVNGNSNTVPANTAIDLQRLENNLASLTPGRQVQALLVFGMAPNFRNGYIETYTAGVEYRFGDFAFNASYLGTAGVKLVGFIYPNNYAGAEPAFAPFTRFDSSGRVLGGIGPEFLIGNPGHSTFHSLETGVSKTSSRWGLGFQASYTFSKSIDNASTPVEGFIPMTAGAVLQPAPQDPRNPGAEKGPSTFDLTHVLSLSLIQNLPFERAEPLRPLGRFASGWQLLGIGTVTTGPPFTVLSGIQQTGLGENGADRPDQIGLPVFSTSRPVREDYFGQASANSSFFYIPIGVPGGTGPDHGRFGTLGRDTVRGPGYRDLDLALLKETAFGRRGAGEALRLQFRAEFFNVFNRVNFGLPANILEGSGFGVISKTAGSSRQVQLSLKLIY